MQKLEQILEAALMAAGKPLSIRALENLFEEEIRPERKLLLEAMERLQQHYDGRGVEVVEVASGWRIQVRSEFSTWVHKLQEEKPARYSRALLETLALVAYRQPITRGEIEAVRGVAVSSSIIRTLLDRTWIRVLGHREVPGRPALYGTTKTFLDDFGLKGLDELPVQMESEEAEILIRQPLEIAVEAESETEVETEAEVGVATVEKSELQAEDGTEGSESTVV